MIPLVQVGLEGLEALILAQLSITSVLIEHIDALNKLIDLRKTHNPWSDPLSQHLVFVFSPEHLKLLVQVLLSHELLRKVILLERSQLKIFG